MTEIKIPCENCITLPLCNTIFLLKSMDKSFTLTRPNTSTIFTSYPTYLYNLIEKCSLIEKYIASGNGMLTKNINNVNNFYSEFNKTIKG